MSFPPLAAKLCNAVGAGVAVSLAPGSLSRELRERFNSDEPSAPGVRVDLELVVLLTLHDRLMEGDAVGGRAQGV
jgi:hypothetical protein